MYYPKSQIQTNLYTNGGEYVIKNTTQNYVGFYYKLSNGKLYIGKSPQGLGKIEIIPPPLVSSEDITYDPHYVRLATWESDPDPEIDISFDPLLFDTIVLYNYSNLTKGSIDQPRLLPTPYYSKPTPEEEELGEYQRYFAKKTNELVYLEISIETYTKFKAKDPKVAWDLYDCLSMPWSISDYNIDSYDNSNNNRINYNISYLIEKNNNWYGFSSYVNEKKG